MQCLLLLFMVLWVPISATLFKRAVLTTLWHARLFLGLRFSPFFVYLLGGLRCFFLVRKCLIFWTENCPLLLLFFIYFLSRPRDMGLAGNPHRHPLHAAFCKHD
jgi:hypothetical protein